MLQETSSREAQAVTSASECVFPETSATTGNTVTPVPESVEKPSPVEDCGFGQMLSAAADLKIDMSFFTERDKCRTAEWKFLGTEKRYPTWAVSVGRASANDSEKAEMLSDLKKVFNTIYIRNYSFRKVNKTLFNHNYRFHFEIRTPIDTDLLERVEEYCRDLPHLPPPHNTKPLIGSFALDLNVSSNQMFNVNSKLACLKTKTRIINISGLRANLEIFRNETMLFKLMGKENIGVPDSGIIVSLCHDKHCQATINYSEK